MGKSNIGYFIKEGVLNIFLHGFMSVAAIGIIAACLTVTGCFTLIALNIDALVADVEAQSEITVFIDADFPAERVAGIKEEIMTIPHVKSAEFVSKDQALEEYRESLGDSAGLLDGLENDNPLRDSYRIRMESLEYHEEIATALDGVDGIASIESRKDVSEKLIKIRNVVDGVCILLVAMLGGVSIFIISNAVKLATFTRREEIAIMKMVGATNGFVRCPFLVEGLLLGELGALLSYFLQWGFYAYIQEKLLGGMGFLSLLPFSHFSHTLLLALAVAGVVLGAGGSLLTIRRYLKV